MLRVFGVIMLVLISLAWIAYSGFEMLAKKQNSFNPEFVFSDSLDESVLKINFAEELNNFELINSENSFLSLAPNKVEGFQLYFSNKRSILILEKEDFWTALEVNSLVNKTKLNASDIINQKGKFLCFSKEKNLHSNTSPAFNRTLADKNATANIFNLAQNKTSDVYIKSNGTLKYQTKNSDKIYGDAVEDKPLFSDVLPAKITSYLFNSHFYALQNDTVYAKSIMAQWIDKGFVEATFQGETFLVSDYKAQQNPNLVLLQHLKSTDTLAQKNGISYFKNVQLTNRFPKDNGFYLCLIGDKVILTNTEKLVQKIKLTHQLGNTLAVNKGAQQSIFSDLTSAVHTRVFKPNVKFSTTFTKDIVYTVVANGESKLRTEEKSTTFSFLANAKIDFICPIKDHIRKGMSVFIIANKQYYLVSSKGNKIWQGNLDFTQKTQPQVVDVYQNNKLQVTFTNGNKLYVIDLNGNLVNGFPLIHNANFSTASKPVTWKNQTTFLAGDENGKLMYYNSKGGELNAFSISNQSLNKTPSVFNQNGVLTCFIQTHTGVKEVLIDKNKVNALAKQADAIVLHRKEPYLINYKNTGTTLTKAFNNESFGLDRNLKLHINLFSAYNNNQLEIFALNGEKIMDVQIQVSEITEAKIVNTEQSNLILILDDIENNIYLFDDNGTLIDGFPKEGQRLIDIKKITTDSFNVYSTLENNLVCYSITL